MMRQLGILIVLTVFAPCLYAAQIAKVKGTSALVNMGGESALPGDTFFAVEGGKKKAIVKVVKIKGDKAIVKIMKGNAAAGMSLERAASGEGGGSSSANNSGSESKPTRHRSKSSGGMTGNSRAYWGVLLGLAQDSMSVNVNDFNTPTTSLGSVALSGMGFSAKGLFDYELFNQVWFRGTTGLEQFNATGSAKCGNQNQEVCNAKIMYFSLDFIGRFVFIPTGTFRPWGGAGIGLLFPATKSASALASNSIGTTNVLLVTGGFDYFVTPSMYIPVSLEYGMLPKSDEVDAHWIAVRAGLAVPF